MQKAFAFVAVLAALFAAERVAERSALAQKKAPSFQVDPVWPKMPKQWILGQVSGLDVDAPRSRLDHPAAVVAERRREDARTRKRSAARPAPPVMEFDAAGNYLQGWGGEAPELRVAEGRAHHPRRLQRQRLDLVGRRTAPARADREPDPEVHAGRQVHLPGRPSRQEQGQPRHRELQQRRRHLRLPEDQRSRSSPTATSTGASSCSTPTPASSSGCGAPTATRRTMRRRTRWRMRARAAAVQPGARRARVERRPGLRRGPDEQPHAGVHASTASSSARSSSSARPSCSAPSFSVAFSPDAAQQYLYLADAGNGRVHIYDRKSLRGSREVRPDRPLCRRVHLPA